MVVFKRVRDDEIEEGEIVEEYKHEEEEKELHGEEAAGVDKEEELHGEEEAAGADNKISPEVVLMEEELHGEEDTGGNTEISPEVVPMQVANPKPRTPRINEHVVMPTSNLINWNELLFEKRACSSSDVGDYNRLLIPINNATAHLPRLKHRKEKLPITLVDTSGGEWVMHFKYWESSHSFVLTRGWKPFVKSRELNCNDTIQIYAAVNHADRLSKPRDEGRYVYGIHHYRNPVASTRTLRLFGRYFIVGQTGDGEGGGGGDNNYGGPIVPIGDENRFRPNGGLKRRKRHHHAGVSSNQEVQKSNRQTLVN